MKTTTLIFALTITALCLPVVAVAADVPATTGKITKVTVYRGQALVTRNIDLKLPQGPSELIVQNLSPEIVPESIFAQTSSNVKVLSVRYRTRAVKEDTRTEVKTLDQKIELQNRKIKNAERRHTQLHQQWQMFERLSNFTVTAAKSDLDRGLLTYEPIEKLATLIETKGTDYYEQITKLEANVEKLKKNLELLQRQRKELTAGNSRTEREAMLFLSKAGNKPATIELNYLVNNASWQQQYNLRANPTGSRVLIEYNAVVNQTSGEDWNAVTLSLSTAEPTMVAEAPVLEPMLVALARLDRAKQSEQQRDFLDIRNIRRLQKSRLTNTIRGNFANAELNQLAIDNQYFVMNASGGLVQQFQEQLAEVTRNEGISVTYDLPGKLSLPSRSDQQLVTIASIPTQADFRLVATPLLTDYVYLQAELHNNSEYILLPGQASMYRNGGFVGKSRIPQVTSGEKFLAGFGIDSQVQVAHELEGKTSRTQGGNRIDTYNYRIAMSNYKNTPVDLQLLDRLPYSDRDSMKIELEKTTPQLSSDAEYVRATRKKGILRWDLNLQPNTIDEKSTIVKYTYTMEYDKNMEIKTRHAAQ